MSALSSASELRRAFHATGGRGTHQLPPGRHTFLARDLPSRLCHISNNDHGAKPILFDVEGASDFVLDGCGAVLLCCGPVLPIRVGNSRHVTIRNLTIDWVRPGFTPAEIVATSAGRIELSYDPDAFPLDVEHERLVAREPHDPRAGRLWNLLPFDAIRREVSSAIENWHLSRSHRAVRTGSDRIVLQADFPEIYAPGTPVVLMHGDRVAPGIWIENAEDVLVENVTIHHAPGMGVIAQCSRNLTIDRLRVSPADGRLFSTWVDALHMADCDGSTRVVNCDLRGQFDDAVNLHARFSLVGERTGRCSALIRTVHPQHAGPSPAAPGCGWAFYRRATLALGPITRIVTARRVDDRTAEITCADPLPPDDGEWVCGRWDPDSTVEIQGCRFGSNRGRGVLINLEHHVAIHHNHFHVSGRGVESIPDANYWWEGSPVRDLAIRDNMFEDCGFGPCGDDVLYFGPEMPDGADPRSTPVRATEQTPTACSAPALRNIRVEDNTIIRHRGRVLHAHGVDGLVFRNNVVRDSRRYAVSHPPALIDLGPGMGACAVESPVRSAP